MKMQLRLVFLLTVSASVGYTADPSPEDRKAVENVFNSWRQELVISESIGNMHELKYDMALEKKAKKMSECNFVNGDGYMHIYYKKGMNMINRKPILEPLQTKFGCAEIENDCREQDMKQGELLCLIGPKSSYSEPKKGPPGAHCPGAKNSEGLCISGGSGSGDAANSGTDVSYLGSLVAYLSIALMTLF